MEYIDKINQELKPWADTVLDKTVIDLFAGCGGLSLGFEAMGFKTIGPDNPDHLIHFNGDKFLGPYTTE